MLNTEDRLVGMAVLPVQSADVVAEEPVQSHLFCGVPPVDTAAHSFLHRDAARQQFEGSLTSHTHRSDPTPRETEEPTPNS